jgi:hypothetical protein
MQTCGITWLSQIQNWQSETPWTLRTLADAMTGRDTVHSDGRSEPGRNEQAQYKQESSEHWHLQPSTKHSSDRTHVCDHSQNLHPPLPQGAGS